MGQGVTKKPRNRAAQDVTLINQRAIDRRLDTLERQMKALLLGAKVSLSIRTMGQKR